MGVNSPRLAVLRRTLAIEDRQVEKAKKLTDKKKVEKAEKLSSKCEKISSKTQKRALLTDTADSNLSNMLENPDGHGWIPGDVDDEVFQPMDRPPHSGRNHPSAAQQARERLYAELTSGSGSGPTFQSEQPNMALLLDPNHAYARWTLEEMSTDLDYEDLPRIVTGDWKKEGVVSILKKNTESCRITRSQVKPRKSLKFASTVQVRWISPIRRPLPLNALLNNFLDDEADDEQKDRGSPC